MRPLSILKHKAKKICCLAKFAPVHTSLHLSILLCFLLSSCTAIKEATYRAEQKKINTPKDTTRVTAFDQVTPVKGKVISPFGYRGGRQHTGVDIKLQKGDTVRAAYCGLVTKAAPYFGYGNLIILKHANNIETYYSHLSKCLVQEGDSVIAGQTVGLGGRTGRATTDHLHFEVRYNRVPHNPENHFDFSSGTVKIPFMAYSPVTRTITIKTPEIHYSGDEIVTVKKGDTLFALAKQNGMTVKELQELNNMKNSFLSVGMKLKIK